MLLVLAGRRRRRSLVGICHCYFLLPTRILSGNYHDSSLLLEFNNSVSHNVCKQVIHSSYDTVGCYSSYDCKNGCNSTFSLSFHRLLVCLVVDHFGPCIVASSHVWSLIITNSPSSMKRRTSEDRGQCEDRGPPSAIGSLTNSQAIIHN